jgi:hypothetical protein
VDRLLAQAGRLVGNPPPELRQENLQP